MSLAQLDALFFEHERGEGGYPKLAPPAPAGGRPPPRTVQETLERRLDLCGVTEPHLREQAKTEIAARKGG